MKKQFTLTRTEVLEGSAATLMAEIAEVTGSEASAASILRSLERLGTDPSILHYEMTHVPGNRSRVGGASSAWRVRADRGEPIPAEG